MKTYPYYNDTNQMVSFEIDNTFITIKKVKKTICDGILNAKIIEKRDRSSEIKFEFSVDEQVFECIEPFGDNSRYLICSKDDNPISYNTINSIEKLFR